MVWCLVNYLVKPEKY